MVRTVQDARECCGGKGYLRENRFAALRGDSDVFVTFEGDNTVLLQLVAKTLLSDYAAQFEDLDAVGMVRHLTTRGATRLITDLARRWERVELRDPQWQQDMLALREERLVDSLARRLRELTGNGEDPLRALSLCQDHALAAARAHVERRVHEHFAPSATTPAARAGARPVGAVDDRAGPRLVARARRFQPPRPPRPWWLRSTPCVPSFDRMRGCSSTASVSRTGCSGRRSRWRSR